MVPTLLILSSMAQPAALPAQQRPSELSWHRFVASRKLRVVEAHSTADSPLAMDASSGGWGGWAPFLELTTNGWGTWSLVGMTSRHCEDPSECPAGADAGVALAWRPSHVPISLFAGAVASSVDGGSGVAAVAGVAGALPVLLGRGGALRLSWTNGSSTPPETGSAR